jgi:uncharacterized protein (DUF697 family)
MIKYFFWDIKLFALTMSLFHRARRVGEYKVHWKKPEFNEEVEIRKYISVLPGEAMGLKNNTNWTLVPGTASDIAAVRERCRKLVRRRAMVSAGVAAVPVPGLDLLSDMRLFAQLIDDINHEFGLSDEQIEQLQPKFKLIAYEAAVGVGGMLIGKVITRELVSHVLRRTGMKTVARQAGKMVPFAGQIAAAGLGFFAFRQIGYQHVEACAKVAALLVTAGVAQDGVVAHPV